MANTSLNYRKSVLNYEVIGNGSKILLMFHGFGQSLNTFKTLAPSLSDTYTLYIFDLYFHGKSQWGYGELPLTKEVWKETMDELLSQSGIKEFSVAGYSLGAKFVLALVEAFPDKIKGIYLLAPDGIKTSFWFSLATYPLLFRKLFKSMIGHPERFLGLSRALSSLHLLDKGLVKFAEHQMNTTEKRERVYYSWVVFRELRFNLNDLAALINTKQIPLTLIVGKFDKVITPANMQRFIKRLKKVDFKILESGHNGLIAESIAHFS